MMEKRRFAVLLCAEESEYVTKKYGGYFGVFVRMLAEEGEIWDGYRVAAGEFPHDEDLEGYEGFVITGSCNDAHGDDDWICQLLALLKKLDSMKKKVLGICFGHQILGRSIGGKTGRSLTGWDIGVRSIQLSSASSKLFSTSLNIPPVLSITKIHQDEIRELPPKAEVMAWSTKTGIEMFRYGDHIMGIQGHPEYNDDILLHLVNRLSCSLSHLLGTSHSSHFSPSVLTCAIAEPQTPSLFCSIKEHSSTFNLSPLPNKLPSHLHHCNLGRHQPPFCTCRRSTPSCFTLSI